MLGPWRNLEFRSPCHRAQLGKRSRNTFLEDGECGSDNNAHKCLLKSHMPSDLDASVSTWREVSRDVSQGSIFYH